MRKITIATAIGVATLQVVQTLLEAVVLSLFGGLLGIAIALSASIALANALDLPFVWRVDVMLGAALFSALVGVVFGYYPARKAAQLDPIEALRHE